jgi:hypothetical protein
MHAFLCRACMYCRKEIMSVSSVSERDVSRVLSKSMSDTSCISGFRPGYPDILVMCFGSSKHTCFGTFKHPCFGTFKHTCFGSSKHTCFGTFKHTCFCTSKHIHVLGHPSIRVLEHLSIRVLVYPSIRVLSHPSIRVFGTFKHTCLVHPSIRVLGHPSILVFYIQAFSDRCCFQLAAFLCSSICTWIGKSKAAFLEPKNANACIAHPKTRSRYFLSL